MGRVVPGGSAKGRVPQELVRVSLPKILIQRIEELIAADGSANSVPDFVRQAAVRELGRRRGEPVPDDGARETMKRVRAR